MSSKLEMASNALLLLGDEPITDFLGKGAGTRTMDALYETTYVSMLTSAQWTFSRTQAVLVKNVIPPLIENFACSYDLPADSIKVLGLSSNQRYQLYAGSPQLLYTNDSNAELEYFLRTPEANVPADFVELMEAKLAERACIAVTGDKVLKTELEGDVRKLWLTAVGTDAQEDTNDAVRSSPFTEVRN